MIEALAIYFGIGAAWLLGGMVWNHNVPKSAFDWAWVAGFLCLWPFWLGFLIKEWME